MGTEIVLVKTDYNCFFTFESSIKEQLANSLVTLRGIKPLLAFIELDIKTPLDIQELEKEEWKIQSRRPGKYLTYLGLKITNELPSSKPPLDALVIFEQKLSSFEKIRK